jgi:adenine deaminase
LKTTADGSDVHVIGVREGTLLSEHLVEPARVENGHLAADCGRDMLHAFVFDRYYGRKAYGCGFVNGFGLKAGAMGTTYAHDSHNLIIVGTNLVDILTVLDALKKGNGGMALALHGRLVEHIPMPFYGIISHLDVTGFLKKETRMRRRLRTMGVPLANPFFQMSFLSLPVIPALRLTTRGLFDVARQSYIPVSSVAC